jgi:hypothetical protein
MTDILLVLFFCSFRFAMTFPFAVYTCKFSFGETLLWCNAGGLLGILYFAYLSELILTLWRKYIRKKPVRLKRKKVFTPRKRRMVRIKSKYGLIGVAMATPTLLSIPVGVFLVIRYFSHTRYKLAYLFGANLFWSVIYAVFWIFIRDQVRF